jgi:hypothetical protein
MQVKAIARSLIGGMIAPRCLPTDWRPNPELICWIERFFGHHEAREALVLSITGVTAIMLTANLLLLILHETASTKQQSRQRYAARRLRLVFPSLKTDSLSVAYKFFTADLLLFNRPRQREAAGGHQSWRQATLRSVCRLDLRSMKPFTQRLVIISGRQF